MHALELLKQPEALVAKPVYAVSGDDPFLRRETIAAIVRTILGEEEDELAVARFAGDQATLADVIDELRTLPFFAKTRVVIVDGADPFVTAHRKELEEYVEHPVSSGVLVLSVRSWPSNTKLAKLVEAAGLSVSCKGPEERERGAFEKELVPWLVHYAKSRHGVQLELDAARLLVELVGPEIGLLVTDVDKLYVYVGERPKIHRDDVARMVGAGRTETIWKALDAATTGNTALALELLDRLLAAGEPPVRVLAAFSASLLKVYHAGRLRAARLDLKEACRVAGAFPAETVRQQHAHLGPSRVDAIPRLLLQADLDMKGSSVLLPNVVLERLMVALGLPRND
ncbi:MAG: DNA polymerase III subunit delta [Isosphaeraceae bacterium]|nr:DNA polymerase III subunit delta [Isosphaeraceae bacterium]